MDIEQARFNMIEQQIRPWEVLDPQVLDTLAAVPREQFVPEQYRHLAFADINIPLGSNQVMMQPKVEARLVQELNLQADHKVLEIGTGSGFVTALLATLVRQVVTVEINEEFIAPASEKLAQQNIRNVTFENGDGSQGWQAHASYDAILLTGSVPSLPDVFKSQLAPGGRIVAIVGQPPIMEAMVWHRLDEQAWQQTSIFDCTLPPLVNSEKPPVFVF